MATNEEQLGILAAKRLNLPPTERLRLQTFIPNALNILARDCVNDVQKRYWLMTAPDTVTATITSDTNGLYYADLTTVINTYGVMKDYLQYGSIFWSNSGTFLSSAVSTADSWVTVSSGQWATGTAVKLSGTLPNPLSTSTTYYLIAVDATHIRFAASLDDVESDTYITLTTQGTGTITITAYQNTSTLQWLNQAQFANLPSALPINYLYCYLKGDRLYVTGTTAGTLGFNVPFVPPTLASLPQFLESDLLDSLVSLAATAGIEPKTEATR